MEHKKQLVKFNLKKIIVVSFFMFLIPLIISVILKITLFKRNYGSTNIWYLDIIIYVVSIFLLIIIHELIHALGFMLFGKVKKEDIKFGVAPKQGMVFCTCNKPITAKAYILIIVLPVIITGIVPLIIVTIWGNIFWLIIFAIMVSGGAGDIIMLREVMKLDKNQLVLDHPQAPAFYILYEKGKEPDNFVETTVEQEQQLLDDMKKSPFEGSNLGIKVLLILLFLSISVIVMGIIGFILLL